MVTAKSTEAAFVKACLLVAADFTKTGGMDRANYALAEHLANRGVETHLVAYKVSTSLLANDRIFFHRVPKLLNSYLASEPLLDRFGRVWAARIGSLGGRVIVNGSNCAWRDVNWVHYVHAAYAPLVLQRTGRDRDPQRALVRVKNWIHLQLSMIREQHIVRRARLVIANSQKTKSDLIERVSISPSRIACVYLGTDDELFHPATRDDRARARSELDWPIDRPVVLFIGGLGDRRKGFDTVFRAWRRLCAVPSWDADLAVVGTGAEAVDWNKRACVDGIESRIRFLGRRDDVPRLLTACDALVAPTRYEAYGLAVQEALCCGLPSFVTYDAGVAEQYPPSLHQLLLRDPSDDVDLAQRLKAWRARPDAFQSELTALAARLRMHTWQKMAADLMTLVEGWQ